MSIFRPVPRSYSFCPASKKTALPSATMIIDSPHHLWFGVSERDGARRRTSKPKVHPLLRGSPDLKSLESVFVNSLVAAGSCRDCTRSLRTSVTVPNRFSGPHLENFVVGRRYNRRFSTSSSHRQKEATAISTALKESSNVTSRAEPEITKSDYNYLVDTYGASTNVGEEQLTVLQGKSEKHSSLAHPLVYTPEQEDRHEPRQILPPVDTHHRDALRTFHAELKKRPGRIDLDELWELFLGLHSPRLRYISDFYIDRLFEHLAWVKTRDAESSHRYFDLLEECLSENLTVKVYQWNTAISFAGKWVRYAGDIDVRRAIETWMRMEEHGVPADNVTFNILFHVAVKARRFALADTIFNELKSRNLQLNAFFRHSMIYYAGMRGDGDGVRQAFRDLVNADEIVSTGTMNTVISSLIRAGEAPAAEHVFIKMKALHETKFLSPIPRDWQGRRELMIRHNELGFDLRRERELHESFFFGSQFSTQERREEIQKASPIAPDVFTYAVLIKWHSYTSGNMTRVRELMAEMEGKGIQVTNDIFFILFRGFATHGGHAYTEWSRWALERFWNAFLAATEETAASHGEPQTDSVNDSPASSDLDIDPANLVEDQLFVANAEGSPDETQPEPHLGPELPDSPLTRNSSNYQENARHDDLDLDHDDDDDDDNHSLRNNDADHAPYPSPEAGDDTSADTVTSPSFEREAPRLNRKISSAVLSAFFTCAGKTKMLEVWAVVQDKWTGASEQEVESVRNLVRRFEKMDGRYM